MDKALTLAIISPVFPPYRSGMGTVAQEQARMAREGGFDATVLTPGYHARDSTPAVEQINGYTVRRLQPLIAYGNAAFLPQLFWMLRSASIIHLHYPALGMELPVLLWRLWGKRVVITYHMDLVGKGWFMRTLFRLYSQVFLPLVMGCASRILVTSYDYARHSPLLAPWLQRYREKFIELPCSVRTDYFTPDARPSSAVGGSPYPFILFVGALDSAHYSKGITVLLDAFACIGKTDQVKLVIIGDGDLRRTYEQHARQLGIADRVLFTGTVAHDDLPGWYAASSFLVLPSTDSTEAFGVVLIEAGASGIPVIATHLPGVRSVIEEGITGFLVEANNVRALAEKMSLLLSNPARARAMGRAARRRVEERYSYTVVSDAYIRVLNDFSHI